ncbi:MAG: Jag N-terminal domain-containing protein [Campylobacter sputorum]|uniref:Jag N-terminal domain-containing protein n=1 Tax=Campylobacter sputorum TaxID=206 RepID=UPI000B776B00|nr:Jag N-terminal domain-containing protein [Campylobacter sputorum]ASM38891.1 putative RNA-binding protein (Jag domain) [Campylobacter sputorum bv. paraureolyticus LMG 11764]MDY6121130.1 Jag N-terminal domain-containing protein [Campylobacter sputorum]
MKKFEAPTLQEAISKASLELNCSILDLEYNILQNSNSGFFGFFKKSAIIEAINKNEKQNNKENHKSTQKHTKEFSNEKRKNHKKKSIKTNQDTATNANVENLNNEVKNSDKKTKNHTESKTSIDKDKVNSLVDNFYNISKNADEENRSNLKQDRKNIPLETIDEIKKGLELLFSNNCFNINKIEVSEYSKDCVLINLDGEDAALLIGKEGYRYKALSYLLFNWINNKFNLSIRLEIAEFLKTQEERISIYTQSVIQRVEKNGYAQTKILDGVLIKIALEQLRAKFPEKYVGIKTSNNGKFIVVNDFIKKHE